MGQCSSLEEACPNRFIKLNAREWAKILGYNSLRRMKDHMKTISEDLEKEPDTTAAERLDKASISRIGIEIDRVPKYISFCKPVRPLTQGRILKLRKSFLEGGVRMPRDVPQLTAILQLHGTTDDDSQDEVRNGMVYMVL